VRPPRTASAPAAGEYELDHGVEWLRVPWRGDPLEDEASPPLDDADLDRLFAGPQRPRWKLGMGAVVVLALVACAVVVLAIALQPRSSGIPALDYLGDAAPSAAPTAAAPSPQETSPATVLVHVAGEVQQPGVYELAAGDRVIDAIEAAGGVTESADADALNYARPLVDGEQVYVPKPGEAPPAAEGAGVSGGGSAGGQGGLVNLNTATSAELETLPRIGPAMAQRIIDYRDQHGGFTSVDELLEVAGIGEATYAGLKDLVTV
jgi:competence protein ComEA